MQENLVKMASNQIKYAYMRWVLRSEILESVEFMRLGFKSGVLMPILMSRNQLARLGQAPGLPSDFE
jgi:hypothetical protein